MLFIVTPDIPRFLYKLWYKYYVQWMTRFYLLEWRVTRSYLQFHMKRIHHQLLKHKLDWTQWIFTYYSYTRKGECPISPVTSNIHPVTRLQKLSLSTAICLAFRIEIIISHFDFSFVSIMIHGFGLHMRVRSCYAYTYVHKYPVCWR